MISNPALLLDATAVGQFTPGPLGALAARVGIFLPAFILGSLSGPLVPRLRQSIVTGGFLDSVNAASLALMARVTWRLGRAAILDWMTVMLAVVSAVVSVRWKVSSAWLVAAGAVVGLTARH